MTSLVYDGSRIAWKPKRLTKAMLDGLRRKAQADPGFNSFVADAGQPGLYAWARRERVRFVFAYRPPGGGRRWRMSIDDYGAIDLTTARKVARQHRNLVAEERDPEVESLEEARRAMTVGKALDLYLEDFRQRAESGAKTRTRKPCGRPRMQSREPSHRPWVLGARGESFPSCALKESEPPPGCSAPAPT